MNAPRLLAIDAGQTGSKIRVVQQDGSVQDDLLPGVLTDRPLAPQLAATVAEIVARSGVPAVVAIGVSGVTDPGAEADELLRDPALAGVQRVLVAHDSTTSYLGVLGDAQGAVIAVGTGVVTLGVGPSLAVRVDGWGNLMGDAGSAYWIGREALDAVMRAYDGRGPATELTTPVRERWPDLETAYIDLQGSADRVRIIASFAAVTAALAEAGDAVSRGICERAADELALSTLTALRTAGAPEDAPVGATGGVLRSALIRTRFETSVHAIRPRAAFVPPSGTGLDGVVALTTLAENHPLRSRLADVTAPTAPHVHTLENPS